MAATAFETENAVWQKVFQMLAGQAGTGATGAADPASVNAFRALKLQMSTQKLAPNLQFVPFQEADVIAATGFAGPTGVFTLYGVWAKKTGTGTTASYLEIRNQNTATGAAATGALVSAYFKSPGDEAALVYPKGVAYSSVSGTTIFDNTVLAGVTGANSATGDAQHGFLIIGA